MSANVTKGSKYSFTASLADAAVRLANFEIPDITDIMLMSVLAIPRMVNHETTKKLFLSKNVEA